MNVNKPGRKVWDAKAKRFMYLFKSKIELKLLVIKQQRFETGLVWEGS